MSRQLFWEYAVPSAAPDERAHAEAYWESFFYDCPLPVRYVPSGAITPGAVTVLLHANRAKARRLAAFLDGWFGAPGELRECLS